MSAEDSQLRVEINGKEEPIAKIRLSFQDQPLPGDCYYKITIQGNEAVEEFLQCAIKDEEDEHCSADIQTIGSMKNATRAEFFYFDDHRKDEDVEFIINSITSFSVESEKICIEGVASTVVDFPAQKVPFNSFWKFLKSKLR